jgi:hypothetical protein
VFDADSRTVEAKGFLDINSGRRPLTMLDKFNALVMAADQTALAAKSMVEADGYQFAAAGQFTLKCVGSVMRACQKWPAAAAVAWKLCVDMYEGHPVHERVFEGLVATQRHLERNELGSLADAHYRHALVRSGPHNILRSIMESVAYNGGGPKAWADGIVRLLNKGRRTRRIPSVYGDVIVPDEGESE